jgi:hypothetical protein
MTRAMDPHLAGGNRRTSAALKPQHFGWTVERRVGVVTLNRPERKNPLTFDSYAELRDLFRALAQADDVRAVVVQGAGGNFCSGGDVHEIIGPLTKMAMPDLLTFTRMTGDLVKAMRACPQPIVAAIDGVCAGAGAIVAMASDLRVGTARSKVAFLFTRVGLAGCDMGACSILPRLVTRQRAAGVEQLRGTRCERARLGGRDRVGSELRPCDDQAHAASGMGDGRRRGDRGRGAGAGDLHDDAGLPPRLPRLCREAEAAVRGRLR